MSERDWSYPVYHIIIDMPLIMMNWAHPAHGQEDAHRHDQSNLDLSQLMPHIYSILS